MTVYYAGSIHCDGKVGGLLIVNPGGIDMPFDPQTVLLSRPTHIQSHAGAKASTGQGFYIQHEFAAVLAIQKTTGIARDGFVAS